MNSFGMGSDFQTWTLKLCKAVEAASLCDPRATCQECSEADVAAAKAAKDAGEDLNMALVARKLKVKGGGSR